ncbi:hypothetical protein BJ508DRAFT_332755 [Ascobolus immersus RN42]|uniref:Uncharacterized protein n=1 Tax=Ascobolus immersus RN42 TaxID=1160509 RepID=A0A3N4HLN9_ASCIM|nr:hypothetical protein BJ508DRAFT_332755 [Ascobolus immersus RN42]
MQYLELDDIINGTAVEPRPPSKPAGMPDTFEPEIQLDENAKPLAPPEDPWAEHRRRYNEALEEYNKKLKAFRKKKLDAFYYLKNSVVDSIRTKLAEKTNVTDAYTWLRLKYESVGLGVMLKRRIEFFRLNWDGETPIDTFFDLLNNKAAPLRKANVHFSLRPIDILQMTINGMPERYDAVIENLCLSTDASEGVTEEMIEVFQSKLRDVYLKEKENQSGRTDKVLASKEKPRPPQGKPYLHLG